ncbi:MAG: hypothetical protein K0Q87_3809 [Neobacillus sp.]|jgi:hypothetical protein|nr:hypothetical protein [Neobacillus sp.]
MSKNSTFVESNAEALIKILDQQKYPFEANDYLIFITRDRDRVSFFDIVLRAFQLGVILGKRAERTKKTG